MEQHQQNSICVHLSSCKIGILFLLSFDSKKIFFHEIMMKRKSHTSEKNFLILILKNGHGLITKRAARALHCLLDENTKKKESS